MDEQLEDMVAALEGSGRYRVLRRLEPRQVEPQPVVAEAGKAEVGEAQVKRAVFIDCETTGLEPAKHEVIELALVPFFYTLDGRILEIAPAFSRLRQPSHAIPAAITALTGITDAMVAGAFIEPIEIAALIEPADLVIAHNAGFDRRFAERLHPAFARKAWACSMREIPWRQNGFEGFKLAYLLTEAGFFHEGHRALGDCWAAIELLSRPLGSTGQTGLAHLVAAAAEVTSRIWAVGAPYDCKDLLRARSYRWNPGRDGRPRAWYIDCHAEAVTCEIAYLRNEIFGQAWQPMTTRITAYERYSDRA